MNSVLNEAYFHDEAAAFAALEAIIWPNGPTCPHCGATDRINRLQGVKDKKGQVRHGLWKCYHCRKQLTVRKNTVFESSHLKLHQWFQVAYLMCSSKKGISSNQLARTLGCQVKTAWFASHRIREAMRAGKLSVPFGSGGGAVEADETYIGKIKGAKAKRGGSHKNMVFALVDRQTGKARTFHIDGRRAADIVPIVRSNLSKEARLVTDEAPVYVRLGREFAAHDRVDHFNKEYVRYETDPKTGEEFTVTTNTAENYFSVFKRGMKGIYQHCSEKHLHRHLAEFDFRYNARIALGVDDHARTRKALAGIVGKRLTYRGSSGVGGV